jgi:signal transduction histidine kinase
MITSPTEIVRPLWRRWAESELLSYIVLLDIALIAFFRMPGRSWTDRLIALGLAAAFGVWLRQWHAIVRTDIERRNVPVRVLLALCGVLLTIVLGTIHGAYFSLVLLLIPPFFVELPVSWAIVSASLLALAGVGFSTVHPLDAALAREMGSAIVLRLPILITLGLVVRATAVQSEERRHLVDARAAAERQAGVLQERHRLAREIHDTLSQGFAAILVHLSQADAACDASSSDVRPHLVFAQSVARENLEEARRLMKALRPQLLERGEGLPPVLRRVTTEWAHRTGVQCALTVTGTEVALHATLEVLLLRGTQELLANVRRHAHASHVTVTLSYMSDLVVLDVRDDGMGFPEVRQRTFSADANDAGPLPGVGLQGLRERAALLDGTLTIESAPGEGATATLTIPVSDTLAEAERAA